MTHMKSPPNFWQVDHEFSFQKVGPSDVRQSWARTERFVWRFTDFCDPQWQAPGIKPTGTDPWYVTYVTYVNGPTMARTEVWTKMGRDLAMRESGKWIF